MRLNTKGAKSTKEEVINQESFVPLVSFVVRDFAWRDKRIQISGSPRIMIGGA
jgi:hypothetical protein